MMDNMYCKQRYSHTRQAAEQVAIAKCAAGGKWKAIHCQECSLWHVECINGEQEKGN